MRCQAVWIRFVLLLLLQLLNIWYLGLVLLLLLLKIHGALLMAGILSWCRLPLLLARTIVFDLLNGGGERERERMHREHCGFCKWALYSLLFDSFSVNVCYLLFSSSSPSSCSSLISYSYVCCGCCCCHDFIFFFFVAPLICFRTNLRSCSFRLCDFMHYYIMLFITHIRPCLHVHTDANTYSHWQLIIFSLSLCMYVLICPENIIALHWFFSHSSVLFLHFCLALSHIHSPHTHTHLVGLYLFCSLCLSLD